LRWAAPLLLLSLTASLAVTFVVEGESLAPPSAPRGVDGAPPGWYVVPYLYGDESSAASLVSARTLADGQVSAAAARIAVPDGHYRIWARVGCRDRAAQAGFALTIGGLTRAIAIDAGVATGKKHVWLPLTDAPVHLDGPTEVTLRDAEPTTVAALDLLAFSDDPAFEPSALPLPRWPNAGAAAGLSARFWLPALFDEPLYVTAGLTWPVLLSVTNRDPQPVAGGQLTIELPPGVTMLDPTARELGQRSEHFSLSAAAPRTIHRSRLAGGGERLELALGEIPAGLDGMTSTAGSVALMLQAALDAPPRSVIRVGCRTPTQDEAWTPCDLVVLPAPPVRPGPRAAYWLLDLPYLAPFSAGERRAVLQSAALLGYNRVNLIEGLQHDDLAYDRLFANRYAMLAGEARAAGLEPVMGMVRWIPWTPHRTYSDRYLATHPNAAAVLAPGARAAAEGRRMVSPTALLEYDGDYFEERLNDLATLARQAAIREVYWDDEENRPLELSFDPASLDLFSRVANLPRAGLGPVPPMTPQRILGDPALRKQWVAFRCEQNSAITALLRRRMNALIPGLRLFIYSGFQSEHTAATYGVDWRLVAPHADGVIAGSGWANITMISEAHATWQAVRRAAPGAQTMFVEHAINDWPGTTRWSDPTTTTARVVLAAAAGAVGLNDCCSVYTMDGRHLSGIAAAASFVAEHEKLLATGQRTVYDTNGDGYLDTVVVRAVSSVLTVTANGTQHPQTLRPRVGQAGELPAEVTLLAGGWQAWRDDNAPIVPQRPR